MTAAALVASLSLAFVPLRTPVLPMPPATLGIPTTSIVPVVDHLRPQGARASFWLREAMRVSPTVRRLAGRLEHSDVIVYLDISHALDQGVSACLTWMAGTASRRIVRATFRAELTPRQAISLLAHELAHAVEVADHREVQSEKTLLAMYTRIGHRTARSGLHWDTDEAIAVGDLARLEAAGAPRGAALRKGTS